LVDLGDKNETRLKLPEEIAAEEDSAKRVVDDTSVTGSYAPKGFDVEWPVRNFQLIYPWLFYK
ncbi:unnamed protein product, partial [Didymodactylos carnosus]